MNKCRLWCGTVDGVGWRSGRGVTGVFAVLLAAGVVLAGPASSGAANRQIASEVPAGIRAAGVLRVASGGPFAPDRPLARALARLMGLKVTFFSPPAFREILPGVVEHKYDLGMRSITDTKAREKLVNFVTYFKSGVSFYVRTNGPVVNAPSDLCGHKVGVLRGSVEERVAAGQRSKCVSSGRPTLTLIVFAGTPTSGLLSGRVDVAMEDTSIASDEVRRSGGRLKLSGRPFDVQRYGIAIAKHSGLTKPVLDGLKLLISDGTYLAILTKAGQRAGAISHPKVNGGVS
jgi:polar amino acid transport system substrate-binding protein